MVVPSLPELLRYKRPARSESEEDFIARYLPFDKDSHGNLLAQTGPGNPTILWSCHTDTVHQAPGYQGLITVADRYIASKSNCLGADDTTGIWIMLNMIAARTPGLYIFHRDEEIGGRGSRHIAKTCPQILTNLRAAIAFDRKGYGEAITHQLGQRTCSEAFALTLGTPTIGSFTDTANYTHMIPDCTNVSVGYFNQHTSQEYQDVQYARQVVDRFLSFHLR